MSDLNNLEVETTPVNTVTISKKGMQLSVPQTTTSNGVVADAAVSVTESKPEAPAGDAAIVTMNEENKPDTAVTPSSMTSAFTMTFDDDDDDVGESWKEF